MSATASSPRRLPVTIVTGFLGSGKTTLLQHVLSQPGGERICVIVNEFGDIGLDHLLLEASDDDVILLAKGCLCCTIRGSLGDTFRDIAARQAAGRMPGFDRIVIETSGLANPASILHLITADPGIAARHEAAGVVTVVDGLDGPARLARHPEAIAQVTLADLLLISKSDLVGADALDATRVWLSGLAPGTPVDSMRQGKVDAATLFALHARGGAGAVCSRHGAEHGHEHEHDSPSRFAHDEGIETLVVGFDAPLSRARLGGVEAALRTMAGPSLLRVKGILLLEDDPLPLVVQGVRERLYPYARLAGDRHDRVQPCLVFITQGDMRKRIESLLAPLGGTLHPHG